MAKKSLHCKCGQLKSRPTAPACVTCIRVALTMGFSR